MPGSFQWLLGEEAPQWGYSILWQLFSRHRIKESCVRLHNPTRGSCWASSGAGPTVSLANVPDGMFATVHAGDELAHKAQDWALIPTNQLLSL